MSDTCFGGCNPTNCLLLLWNTDSSVIYHLWLLGQVSRLEQSQDSSSFLLAGCDCGSQLWNLSPEFLSQILTEKIQTYCALWPDEQFRQGGLPTTVQIQTLWENSFQNNRFFKLIENVGKKQILKYTRLRLLPQTNQPHIELWNCFCVLCAIIISCPSSPSHSINFLTSTTAWMLQMCTSV